MLLSPVTRAWARHLLAYEAAGNDPRKKTKPAASLVYEKLRSQLCGPVGVDGFQVLASRALRLSQAEVPRLATVQVTAEGRLLGLADLGLQADPDQEREVGVILIAHLLGLLLSFLGESTTCRLIQDIFPHPEIASGEGALTPFKDILQEVNQLRKVSERLEALAGHHAFVQDGLCDISGNIRDIAAILDVFAVIRKRSDGVSEGEPKQQTTNYVM